MQIELIGCTSAGKSSLSQQLLKSHNNGNSFHLVTSYDFVLRWAHFDWVKQHQIRMLILNLVALLACLFTWRRNLPLYRFVISVIYRLPAKVSLSEKLKIARIVARNVGIYEIVRRNRSENQIILADEGTLHIANYLFVHVTLKPNLGDLRTFINLVSLPDVAVYIKQPEYVLIDRTSKKGHKRIPKGSPALIDHFIQHSLTVFENLVTYPCIKDRLVIINNGEVTTPDCDAPENPQLEFARRILELNPTPK